MAGSNGSGAGTINATGYHSYLYFDNTQTVSNATINLGNSSYYAFLDEYDTAGAGNQVLTLATSVTVDAQDDAYITSSGYSGDGIVNQGVIEQTGTGARSSSSPTPLPTAARLTPRRRPPLLTSSRPPSPTAARSTSPTATRTSSRRPSPTCPPSKLTGGTYEADAGSTLKLPENGSITTDDARIILNDARIDDRGLQFGHGRLRPDRHDSAHYRRARGIELLADRNWTTAGAAITNDGQSEFDGGELTATASGASLINATGAQLDRFGTVDAPQFTNSGTIEASASPRHSISKQQYPGPERTKSRARPRSSSTRKSRPARPSRLPAAAANWRCTTQGDSRARSVASTRSDPFERHDRGCRTLGLYRLHGERWRH